MHQAAELLSAQYHPGTGIYTSFGRRWHRHSPRAGIPLRDALRDANGLAWIVATERPDLFLHEEWALAISGDPVATAVQRATLKKGPRYYRMLTIVERFEPKIEIYKRD